MVQKKTTRRSERRRSTRADARLSMRVEGLPADGEPPQLVTESQNISASGVYCTSPHFLAPLSKVALTIVLPRLPGGTKELIKCEGIVVRCEAAAPRKPGRGYQLACMFSDLASEQRERLDEFVTWRNLQALRAAANRAGRRAPPRVAARSTGQARKAGVPARRGVSSRSRPTVH